MTEEKVEENEIENFIRRLFDRVSNGLSEALKSQKSSDEDLLNTSKFMMLHLAIERELDNYLNAFFTNELDFKKIELSFSQKLKLCNSVEYLFTTFENVYLAINKINKVRNNLAHNIDFNLSDEDIREIWGTLGYERLSQKLVQRLEFQGKPINNLNESEKLGFICLSLPLLIRAYTEGWSEYLDLKKKILESSEVLEASKKQIEKLISGQTNFKYP